MINPLRNPSNFNRSVLLIVVLSSLLYIELGIGRLFGETSFYSIAEHLSIVLYGLSSFFCSVWSANRIIGNRQDFKWSLAIKYMIVSGLINAVVTSLIFLAIRYVVALISDFTNWMPPAAGLILNVFYTFMTIHLVVASLYLSYFTICRSHEAELRQKEAEKQSTEARFKLLQQQLSPHFLFNSLSTLASLIRIDADAAESYITQFAGLYRFVLQHKDEEIILLKYEVAFVEQYLDLMNLRFDNAYQLQMDIPSDWQARCWIAPGSLQLCIENAIKHNTASSDSPLYIKLELSGSRLFITNRITQKNHQVPSTKTGLENLKARYAALSSEPVIVEQGNSEFCVSIPLVESLNKEEDESRNS